MEGIIHSIFNGGNTCVLEVEMQLKGCSSEGQREKEKGETVSCFWASSSYSFLVLFLAALQSTDGQVDTTPWLEASRASWHHHGQPGVSSRRDSGQREKVVSPGWLY